MQRLLLFLSLAILLLASGMAPAAATGAVPERGPVLRLTTGDEAEVVSPVEIWFEGGDGVERLEAKTRFEAGQPVVRLPFCEQGTVYVVRAGDLVSLPARLPADACRTSGELTTRLRPAARVVGRLAPPRGEDLPTSASLWLAGCPASVMRTPPPAGIPVAVAEDGTWVASVPSACRALRLFSKRFAPLLWRRLDLETGNVTELPVETLTVGAALTAELECDRVQGGLAQTRLDLIPAAVADRPRRGTEPARPLVTAFTDLAGRAAFPGLPSGLFALRSESVDQLVRVSPVFRLTAGEGFLQQVPCLLPASLTVRLTVLDVRLARAERWTVEATPVQALGGEGRVEMTPDADLTASFSDLEPGAWRVTAFLTGNREKAVAEGFAELTGGAAASLDLVVESERFEGKLTYRGEAREARLRLLPHDPVPGQAQLLVDSDAEGYFSVRLPRPGPYEVEVRSGEDLPFVILPEVGFDNPDDVVEVVVPDTRVTVAVTGPQGEAVEGATVTAVPLTEGEPGRWSLLSVPAGEVGLGRYELNGLSPGRWLVTAEKGEQYGPGRELRLEPGAQVEVGLRLEPGIDLAGRVVTILGDPVFPARVFSVAATDHHGQFVSRSSRTTPEGRFRLSLPAEVSPWVNVQVHDGNVPLTALRIASGGHAEVTVPLFGGRVELVGEGDAWRHVNLHRLALMKGDGAVVQPTVADATQLTEALRAPVPRWRMVLPNLAPGTWNLVALTEDRFAAMLRGSMVFPPSLAGFHLTAGQSLRVEAAPPED